MKWDSVNITDKILYLKKLMENTEGVDVGDIYIVRALITGSQNTFSGEMGFEIQPHHIEFMRKLWNTAIENQIDDSIVTTIQKEMRERG
jgi:hypothetical protein